MKIYVTRLLIEYTPGQYFVGVESLPHGVDVKIAGGRFELATRKTKGFLVSEALSGITVTPIPGRNPGAVLSCILDIVSGAQNRRYFVLITQEGLELFYPYPGW